MYVNAINHLRHTRHTDRTLIFNQFTWKSERNKKYLLLSLKQKKKSCVLSCHTKFREAMINHMLVEVDLVQERKKEEGKNGRAIIDIWKIAFPKEGKVEKLEVCRC